MAGDPVRNAAAADYVKEKNISEEQQGATPNDSPSDKLEENRKKDKVESAVVSDAFQH